VFLLLFCDLCVGSYTLHRHRHPTPCTRHPKPYTLNPTPYTLHPKPYTLHPTPHTLHANRCRAAQVASGFSLPLPLQILFAPIYLVEFILTQTIGQVAPPPLLPPRTFACAGILCVHQEEEEEEERDLGRPAAGGRGGAPSTRG